MILVFDIHRSKEFAIKIIRGHRKMKKIIAVVVMMSLLVFASSSFATSINIDRVTGYFYGNGGEFNISGYPNANSRYDSKALVGTGFESFCLEYYEHVSTPGTYDAVVNSQNKAIEGGNGGTTGTGYDIISVGTAYLYSQFAKGILSDYNYTANREASAKILQEAIWWLEGEANGNLSSLLTYETSLKQEFGDDYLIDVYNDAPFGTYGVGVLNLKTSTGGLAQDQLVLVPEPSILLLLGFGLVGVGVLRRRK